MTVALAPADRIESLSCGERMKRALALVADGMPYRDAAKEVGYSDHRELYRWAKRAGLLDVHTGQLVAGYKRISALSSAELERRLTEDPEAIPTQVLAVVSGIAADKAERLSRASPTGDGQSDLVANMLAALQEGGGKVKLEVEVPRTVDVEGDAHREEDPMQEAKEHARDFSRRVALDPARHLELRKPRPQPAACGRPSGDQDG